MREKQVSERHGAVRIGVLSNEPMRMEGLCCAFEGHTSIEVVPGALEQLLADPTIGYLILDVTYSSTWMELPLMVRRMRPDIRQVVLGPVTSDELIMRSIMAGARAYLDSNSGPLAVRQAVESVIQGSIWAPRRLLSTLIDRLLLSQPGQGTPVTDPVLSPRERQVLDLIMTARSNREIAEELGIEERTVKAYVASLLRKTGADNRVTLSVQATQNSMRDGSRDIS